MSTEHERYENDLAPSLLGALEEPEARDLEVHLAGCPHCRAELARLRLATDALPRSVLQVNPPASLKRSLMEVVEREAGEAPTASRARPRLLERIGAAFGQMRPAAAWAAATLLLLAGVATGFGLARAGDGDGARVVAAKVNEREVPLGSASLVLPEDESAGAILRVHGMPTLDPNRTYQVWVQHGDEVVPGSLFSVGGDGQGGAAVTQSLEDADAVMVTREPHGGARAPGGDPILTVEL